MYCFIVFLFFSISASSQTLEIPVGLNYSEVISALTKCKSVTINEKLSADVDGSSADVDNSSAYDDDSYSDGYDSYSDDDDSYSDDDDSYSDGYDSYSDDDDSYSDDDDSYSDEDDSYSDDDDSYSDDEDHSANKTNLSVQVDKLSADKANLSVQVGKLSAGKVDLSVVFDNRSADVNHTSDLALRSSRGYNRCKCACDEAAAAACRKYDCARDLRKNDFPKYCKRACKEEFS